MYLKKKGHFLKSYWRLYLGKDNRHSIEWNPGFFSCGLGITWNLDNTFVLIGFEFIFFTIYLQISTNTKNHE